MKLTVIDVASLCHTSPGMTELSWCKKLRCRLLAIATSTSITHVGSRKVLPILYAMRPFRVIEESVPFRANECVCIHIPQFYVSVQTVGSVCPQETFSLVDDRYVLVVREERFVYERDAKLARHPFHGRIREWEVYPQ
jgi:hypothetical protein